MTLSEAKRAYKRCKSVKGKRAAFNKAMLNLSTEDQKLFSEWQRNL